MSGSTIGGIVGAVVGFYVGGPAGAQYGWMIGSTIGGAVAPETIKAPSIGDAQQQSAQPGAPRPVVYGHPAPFAGNIIDGEAKARKIKVKQSQGKGGPKVESERFLLTSAIRICEGPAKVLRIWRNGEVVYDARDASLFPNYTTGSPSDVLRWAAEIRARSAKLKNRVRIYEGTEDQLPDPALEAIHGVGNTPYYRGTTYIVAENDDVTDTRGAAAQWRFEVVKSGSEWPAAVVVTDASNPPDVGFAIGNSVPTTLYSNENVVDLSGIVGVYRIAVSSSLDTPARLRVRAGGAILFDSGWVGNSSYAGELSSVLGSINTWQRNPASSPPETITDPAKIAAFVASLSGPIVGVAPSYSASMPAGITTAVVEMILPMTGDGSAGIAATFESPDPSLLPDAVTYIPADGGMLIGSDGLIYRASWMGQLDLKLVTPGSVVLAEVVEDVAGRCNVPPDKIDVSALTDLIPGFLIGQQFTGADCLRPTQQAFFYDLPEVDGAIRAVRRGGATVVTVGDDDLVATDDRQERVRPQAVEYPLKVSVVTQDPAAEYAAVPQTSGRLSEDFPGSSEVIVQLPIPLSADATAQIAHKLHKVIHAQAEGRIDLTLPESFSSYVPSDTFDYQNRRWLIEEVRYSEGECFWKASYDRASAYISSATGQPPRPPVLPDSGLRGPTVLAALNLPRLRTADGSPGMYVAARGVLGSWDGCVLQVSADGGETFSDVATITTPGVIATLAADAAAGDTTLSVTTRDGDELSSVSDTQLANRANGFALGTGVPEIGQFKTADEPAANAYVLSDVARGQFGTAAATHVAGEPFVLLDPAVQFLPLDLALAGRTLIFRPVTFGTSEADAPTYSVVYTPQFTTLDIETYSNGAGDIYTDQNGSPYYRIN